VKVQVSRDDLLAGAIFIAFGGAFAYTASTYEVGSLLNMGPGYFPLVLGLILAALGVAIMVAGLITARRTATASPTDTPRGPVSPDGPGMEAEERGSVPWARGGLLLLAILFFGVTVGGLGLGPTLFVTVFLAALAGRGTKWQQALVISLGLSLLSVLIFVVILQLRLPLLGPWLGG
jgi:hypothetical protein